VKDKTNREIHAGDVVDVPVISLYGDDILSMVVVEVSDGGLLDPNGQPTPAKLILQCAIPIKLNPGQFAPVYLTWTQTQLEEKKVGEEVGEIVGEPLKSVN
jgi:hypothetical protein